MQTEKNQKSQAGRRAGCGVREQGIRTSARKKELKARIQRKLDEGRPLTRREQRKRNASLRAAAGVKRVLATQKPKEEPKPAPKPKPEVEVVPPEYQAWDKAAELGWKQDINGRWRNAKGHFVKKEALRTVGLV